MHRFALNIALAWNGLFICTILKFPYLSHVSQNTPSDRLHQHILELEPLDCHGFLIYTCRSQLNLFAVWWVLGYLLRQFVDSLQYHQFYSLMAVKHLCHVVGYPRLMKRKGPV